MGRFFKRIIQGFHKQINIAQKFLFEQMKYNLLISSETRKSINESQIDKMTMSIVGENEQQRNSLVENFEKINNLTKLQMEKKNEQVFFFFIYLIF